MNEFDDFAILKSRSEEDCKILLDIARQALAAPNLGKGDGKRYGCLDHEDRATLERSIYYLEKGFRGLARVSDNSNEGKLARMALCEVMGAAFLIGSAGTYTGSAIAHFRGKHTTPARDKKIASDAPRMRKLEDAILAASKKLEKPLKKSTKFARMIQPEVTTTLGYEPGLTTIREAVERIQTEGTDRAG